VIFSLSDDASAALNLSKMWKINVENAAVKQWHVLKRGEPVDLPGAAV
jgi:hypothetical protein